MPNYQNGKIYSVRSRSRPDLIYIGSTTRRLSERFGRHKAPSASTSAKQIILIGDAYIELIENYSCNSKEELLARERYFIENMECINKNRPIITIEERKEYIIKYANENKDLINTKSKEWYQTDRIDHRKTLGVRANN